MTPQNRYRAFIATLIAMIVMFGLSCLLLWLGRSVEAIGIGGVMMGLLSLLGVLVGAKQDSVTIDNPPEKPVNVTEPGK